MAQLAGRNTATIPRGLVVPFARLGRGLATASGPEVVVTQVKIVLGEMCASDTNHGGLPYNQRLGTLFDLIRHENMGDPSIRELAKHYFIEKLQENVPRMRITGSSITEDEENDKFTIEIKFSVLDKRLRQVIAENISSSVTL